MQNKGVVLGLVIALSVFIGVTWVVHQTNNPLMQRLLVQQSEMISLQKKLLQELVLQKSPAAKEPAQPGKAAKAPVVQEDTRTLARKVSDIDVKVALISEAFKGMKAGQQQPRQAPPPEDYSKVYELPLDHTPAKGKADAPITIISFLDFQCPYCSKFQPTIEEVQAAYPDKVKIAVKHFPLNFHPEAKPAAKAIMAAGEQGKYWEMMDKILKDSRSLGQAKYEEWAKELGMDLDKFKQDLKDKDAEYEKMIAADMALGAKAAVRGTPTLFLDGHKTPARTLEAFKAEIDKILSEKK